MGRGPASVIHRSFLPRTMSAPATRSGPFFAADAIQSNGIGEIDKGARDRSQSRSRRFTSPERTSGIRHEPFCCAVAVRPQQGTTLGPDSRPRKTDDGHQQQALSQEHRLSSIGPPSLSGESVLVTIRDTRRNRRASHAEKERNGVYKHYLHH